MCYNHPESRDSPSEGMLSTRLNWSRGYVVIKIKNQFSELTETNPKKLWPEAVAALIMGIGLAGIAYGIMFRDLTYSHFIAGYSTWLALGKNGDYALIVTFIAASPVVFFFLLRLKHLMNQRFGRESAEDFSSSIKWSLIPFGFWGVNLLVSSEIRFFFPILGVALLMSTVFLASLYIRKYRHKENSLGNHYISSWFTFLKVFAAIASSVLGVLTLVSRLDLPNVESFGSQVVSAVLLGFIGLAGIVAASITSINQFKGTTAEQSVSIKIRLFSIGSPLMLLVLIPEKIVTPESTVSFIKIQPAFWLALTILMVIVFSSILLPDEFKPRVTKFRMGKQVRVLQLIPILVFLKTPNTELPRLGADDYHIGEFTVPGFLLADPSLVVYDTYDPARGFVNFVPGIFSTVFLDGTFTSYVHAFPIIYALILLLILPVLSKVLPSTILLLGLLSFPAANWLSPEIDLLSVSLILIIAWLLYQKREIHAFVILILFGPAGLIFAPGQFALAFISLLPALIVSLWRNRLVLSRFLSLPIFASLGVSAVFTLNFFDTFAGAIRYGQEQSSANTEAYGVPWAVSLISTPQVNVVLFELIRSGWILIPAITLILAPWVFRGRASRERALFFLVPIFLLVVTSIFRAATRIDPGDLSRLGQVSAITSAVLLPVIIFFILRAKLNTSSLAVFLVPIAILGPLTGNSVSSGAIGGIVANHFYKSQVTDLELERMNRTERAFPAIGEALIEAEQESRLLETQSVLKQFEVSDNEFLDLSNRGATYSYLGYVPPLASGAVYNLASSGQQKRAVLSLKAQPPKAILISADNILHDGGPISTRTPLLFQHILDVVDGYFMVDYNFSTWLISKDKAGLYKGSNGKLLEGDEARIRLGKTWGLFDFKGLPPSWGSSITSLESQIQWGLPANPEGNILSSRHSPGESYDLVSTSFQDTYFKRKLVLLRLDVECSVQNLSLREFVLGSEISIIDKDGNSSITVFNVRDGVNIIPLYATIYWLSTNSPTLSNKSIDTSGSPCGPNSITGVRVGAIKVPYASE